MVAERRFHPSLFESRPSDAGFDCALRQARAAVAIVNWPTRGSNFWARREVVEEKHAPDASIGREPEIKSCAAGTSAFADRSMAPRCRSVLARRLLIIPEVVRGVAPARCIGFGCSTASGGRNTRGEARCVIVMAG